MNTPEINDDLEAPLPPRKGDTLFRGDLPDGMNNACLNVMRDGDPIAYMEGYRRGALRLVQHVVKSHCDQDFLVYPIFFLYRHHIELVLKRIIVRSHYLIVRSLTDEEKKHLGRHRLDLLWRDLKPMLSSVCEAAGWDMPDAADIEGIDSYIRQLSALDPDSFSFRYSHSKQGGHSLPEGLKHINLRHFAEMMERLADYLDGIDEGTSELLQAKVEMEAEWRNEMVQYMDYYER
jgi:hypothetical protein